MEYIERKDYNKVITIKLVIPGGCNCKCPFCYMQDYDTVMANNFNDFHSNYLTSLLYLIEKIGDKNPISLDITGNEPTLNFKQFKTILEELKLANIKNKVQRVTLTTNGFNLVKIVPYLKGVVDYVNISIHDYDIVRRQDIMKAKTFTQEQYHGMTHYLKQLGITTSASAVIYKPIPDFKNWFDEFVDWCEDAGFIALRLRCDVFWPQRDLFDQYMQLAMNDKDYTVLTHEHTLDSHWCRLRKNDKFRVFFLKGVRDTSILTKGIEYVVDEDGISYCDFYKHTKVSDYKYEIGKIYDAVLPQGMDESYAAQ